MKTPYTPLLQLVALLYAPFSVAQTLNLTDLTPPLNVPFEVYSFGYQPPGPGGTGLTWDFSTLPDTSISSTSFLDAAGIAQSSFFAGANVVEDLGYNFYDFYGYSAEGINYHGLAALDLNSQMVYQNPQRTMVFPCSYNTSWQDDFGGP